MDYKTPALFLVLVLVMAAITAGCTSASAKNVTVTAKTKIPAGSEKVTHNATGGTSPAHKYIAQQLASVKSDNVVWTTAYRMFSNLQSTEYIHPPYIVDETDGIYKFDCLGFVDNVLMDADFSSYRAIGNGTTPSIESYAGYFGTRDTVTPDARGWTRVAHPADLEPGDICLWLTPGTLDNGHMWIIAGTPSVNPERTSEVLVRIFDSTDAPHSGDSRTGAADTTGLGSGILGMTVDRTGNTTGIYWEGGESPVVGERYKTIVCGRLK